MLAAAEAGVHVLCEKPLDITVAGCTEMIEACRRAGLLLMVDMHKRYDEYHQAMKRKIEAGDLGAIQYGYSHMEDRLTVPRDWLPSWAEASSPAWFLGIHFVDLARWLMGGPVGAEVWAHGSRRKLASLGLDALDAVSFTVAFDNGGVITFDTAWHLPEAFEAIVNQGIRLVGTEGVLECDSQDRGTRTVCSGDDPPTQTHNPSFLRETCDKQGRPVYRGYGIDSIADFAHNVRALLDGASLDDLRDYASGVDGLEATRIVAGAHKSIATGGVVMLR